jgi:hypothetical protein
MATKPCRICRKWFEPHPRAGNRQTVCSSADCQRSRNRKACARWRGQNPNYDRDRRLRERIEKASAPPGARPTAKIVWLAVQHAVGLEVGVVIEESVRHIESWVQHAVVANLLEKPPLSAKVVAVPAQQQLEPMGPEP